MPPLPTHDEVTINEKVYRLRQLMPVDFIGSPKGCPICFFTSKKPKTMHEQVLEAANVKSEVSGEIDRGEVEKKVISLCVQSVEGRPFDIDHFMKNETDISVMMILFNKAIRMSFSIVEPMFLDGAQLQGVDTVAKRYGIQPIDILLPNGGYTPMDAYTFNLTVANKGEESKHSIAKKNKLQWTVAL